MSVKLPMALLVVVTAAGGWWALQTPAGPRSSLDAPLHRPMITGHEPTPAMDTGIEQAEDEPPTMAVAEPRPG